MGLPELMPDEKEPFFFTFRTITQDSWLVKESIGPESPEEYESYSVVVRLMLADVAAEEDVRGNVDVRYDGNNPGRLQKKVGLQSLVTAVGIGVVEKGGKLPGNFFLVVLLVYLLRISSQ